MFNSVVSQNVFTGASSVALTVIGANVLSKGLEFVTSKIRENVSDGTGDVLGVAATAATAFCNFQMLIQEQPASAVWRIIYLTSAISASQIAILPFSKEGSLTVSNLCALYLLFESLENSPEQLLFYAGATSAAAIAGGLIGSGFSFEKKEMGSKAFSFFKGAVTGAVAMLPLAKIGPASVLGSFTIASAISYYNQENSKNSDSQGIRGRQVSLA